MENGIGSEGNTNMKTMTREEINSCGDEMCNTCDNNGATFVAQRIINGELVERALAVCATCRHNMIDAGTRHEFTAIQD